MTKETIIRQLRRELKAEKIDRQNQKAITHYFAQLAEQYMSRYHRCRMAAIKARILVVELKTILADQKVPGFLNNSGETPEEGHTGGASQF